MRLLILILFFAALVAATSVSAGEQRQSDLVAFDAPMQLVAATVCTTPPPGYTELLSQVNITGEAFLDEAGVARTTYLGDYSCAWYRQRFKNPIHMKWPRPVMVTVPEGDTRKPILIAFDASVRTLLLTTCRNNIRPEGRGQLKGVGFTLQATVGQDGFLKTNSISKIGCEWHRLVTGALNN